MRENRTHSRVQERKNTGIRVVKTVFGYRVEGTNDRDRRGGCIREAIDRAIRLQACRQLHGDVDAIMKKATETERKLFNE